MHVLLSNEYMVQTLSETSRANISKRKLKYSICNTVGDGRSTSYGAISVTDKLNIGIGIIKN